MATIITHPIVPVAIAYIIGREKIPGRLLLAACFASILPDFDVIAFKFGIAYSDEFGHRGFTHSLAFSLFIGLVGMLFYKKLNTSKKLAALMMTAACLSHGILDALTNGGLGIAFFWPFDITRYFFPWQILEVSPIGLGNFLSPRGAAVLWSEFLWVWLPALGIIAAGRKFHSQRRNSTS